jgi:hypothetical protein
VAGLLLLLPPLLLLPWQLGLFPQQPVQMVIASHKEGRQVARLAHWRGVHQSAQGILQQYAVV